MPATYTLISSNVLTSSAASVTFSAIPATYTDLVVRCSVRTDNSSSDDSLKINYNNDSTSLYSTVFIRGDGASINTAVSTVAYINARIVDAATATSNTFASTEIYIPSYTASQSKPTSVFFAQEDNSTTAYIGAVAGLYRSNTAISRIDFSLVSGPNFVSGSSFYLYGISNA
jgi:hypothetical protein